MSSVGRGRAFQVLPPSSVASKAPLLPTAQPRVLSRKKMPCNQDREPEVWRAQAPPWANVVVGRNSRRRRLPIAKCRFVAANADSFHAKQVTGAHALIQQR